MQEKLNNINKYLKSPAVYSKNIRAAQLFNINVYRITLVLGAARCLECRNEAPTSIF